MSKNVLTILNKVTRVYGESIDFKTLMKNYFGKLDSLQLKETLPLLQQAGFQAFLAAPKIKTDYPVLFWKEDVLIAYSLGDNNDFILTGSNEKIEKAAFFKEYKIDVAICVPPRDGVDEKASIFWGAFKNIKGLQFELLVIGLFVNIFALGLPLFTLSVYDRVLPTFSTSTLWALTIGIVMILFLDFMFRIQKAKLLSSLQSYVSKYQDEKLLDKFLKMKNSKVSSGQQLEYFHMLQGARDALLMSVFPALADFPFILLFLGIIYMLSPIIVLVPIVLILTVFFVQALFVPVISEFSRKSMDVQKRRESFLYEILFSNISIRLTNATGMIRSKWRMYANNYEHSVQKSRVFQQIGQVSVLSLAQISAVAVLVVGVYEVNNGGLSIGSLIACSILSGRAISPALSVTDALSKYQKVKIVSHEIEMLEKVGNESWVQSEECPEKLLNVKGEFIFRDFYVAYPNMSKPALENINLNINSGEKVGIIGRNGAGKSTLSKSFSGLVTAQNGQLLFDGIDVKRIPVTDLREYVFLLEQSQKLMSGTMRDVIVNSVEVDEKRLGEAVKFSGLESFLQQTGIGLDSEIGENGGNLSGGQRQMLLFAQALYAQPKVLIMDEPTSSFDHELELKVRDYLQGFLENNKNTFVLVTHRMNLLTLVDRLIVMDNGRIVMDGPKDEVLQKLNGKV